MLNEKPQGLNVRTEWTLPDGSFEFFAVAWPEFFLLTPRRYIFRVPFGDDPQRWVPRMPDGSTGSIESATQGEVEAWLKNAPVRA